MKQSLVGSQPTRMTNAHVAAFIIVILVLQALLPFA